MVFYLVAISFLIHTHTHYLTIYCYIYLYLEKYSNLTYMLYTFMYFGYTVTIIHTYYNVLTPIIAELHFCSIMRCVLCRIYCIFPQLFFLLFLFFSSLFSLPTSFFFFTLFFILYFSVCHT